MKVLIIFTGGTIGSRISNGWVNTDGTVSYELLEHYKRECGDGICFETVTPYTVLSENLSATELNLLQDELSVALKKDYDGIIITHGTDTLQYTAAALDYAFGDCKPPVVLVSADYPLEDARSNGHINFSGAIEFIASKKMGGVFVSYKNANESGVKIHLASRILQHSECNADIFSINDQIVALYDQDRLSFFDCKTAAQMNTLGKVNYTPSSHILVVDAHPGDDYSYTLDGVKAIILKPYHSATFNTASDSLKSFCLRAVEAGIPVFAVNIRGGVCYESSRLLNDCGITVLEYSTYISVYMKLWAAVSLKKDITEFAKTPIANELI